MSVIEINPSRATVMAGWDDAPHLRADDKEELLRSCEPHLREARSKGIPSMGAGAIYPIGWSEVSCAPFPIPDWWPRCYALDVGWRATAALWIAWNPADTTWFAYAEYKRGEVEPVVHAQAIKARGEWIPGVIDPAARGRGQRDGVQLLQDYRDLGLNVVPADASDKESGLYDTWTDLSLAKGKFFNTLAATRQEYLLYRRDEKGRVVKENDHLMDDLRLGRRSGKAIAIPRPVRQRLLPDDPSANSSVIDQLAGY